MDFILTGSRAYGPAKPNSDLDIVVKSTDTILIGKFLAERNIPIYNTPSQDSYGDMGGFYFDFADIQINIIVAADEAEYELWRKRTEKMKTIPPIENRDVRLATFNSIM